MKKKMEASGEPGQRGYRQEAQGTGEDEMGGDKFQGNKEGPQEPAHFPQMPDIWDTVGS